jgi:hypothetical protein
MTRDRTRRPQALLGREEPPPLKRFQRGTEYEASGRAAHAGVKPDRGFLLNRSLARFGVALIEVAGQQNFEMAHFEGFDDLTALANNSRRIDDAPGRRQLHQRVDEFVDGPIQMRRENGPEFGDDGANTIVDPVQRQPCFKLWDRVVRHDAAGPRCLA